MKDNKIITISARITKLQKAKLIAISKIRNKNINNTLQLLIDYAKNILLEPSSYDEYEELIETERKEDNKNER